MGIVIKESLNIIKLMEQVASYEKKKLRRKIQFLGTLQYHDGEKYIG